MFVDTVRMLVSMAGALPTSTCRSSGLRHATFRPSPQVRMDRLQCSREKLDSKSSSVDQKPGTENAVLKAAWYSSELLGIAVSFFRQTGAKEELEIDLLRDGSGTVDRSLMAETIRQDYGRSYFVTGNLTLTAYEEDCEFADPAGSFKGLRRFKRNCTNFGSLLEKSNMKLMRWEDFEDRSIGHWRFACVLIFPWRPILSATGYTEYFFDAKSGKVCRHVEHWNVPKMVLLKQIMKPSRWLWSKNSGR